MTKKQQQKWDELRELFMAEATPEAITTFKELFRLDLPKQATAYMIAYLKDNDH